MTGVCRRRRCAALHRHGFVFIQVQPALDDAISLPDPSQRPDQHRQWNTNQRHPYHAAGKHPEQIPPERADLPTVMAIHEGVGGIAALDVVDDQRQPRQHAQRQHQAEAVEDIQPPGEALGRLQVGIEHHFLIHRSSFFVIDQASIFKMPSRPTKFNATSACARTTGLARNATDSPLTPIILRSLAPSPMTIAVDVGTPSSTHTRSTVRRFSSASTMPPSTFPVNLPSTISNSFEWLWSSFKRCFIRSVKKVKPPDTSKVFKPAACTACSISSAPSDNFRRSS